MVGLQRYGGILLLGFFVGWGIAALFQIGWTALHREQPAQPPQAETRW